MHHRFTFVLACVLLAWASAASYGAVTVTEGKTSIPTYAYEKGLFLPLPEDRLQGYPYPNLRARDVAKEPTPRDYRTIVIENDYLKITILPDLGGRIYKLFYKPSGQSVLYENDRLKPNHFCEQGWWFSTGGMEWCFPLTEHSTNVLQPWNYAIRRDNDGGATVTVSDTHRRIGLEESISVTLEPDSCAVHLDIRLSNPGCAPKPYMYWTNPMIPYNDSVKVTLPARWACAYWGDGVYRWPTADARDRSSMATYDDAESVFALRLQGGFAGVYDESRKMGFVRTFPLSEAQGVKVFSFGHTRQPFLQPEKYSDSGEPYFELWGGRTPSLWTEYTLAPREVAQWQEAWYPLPGTGGLRWASEDAAVQFSTDRVDSVRKRVNLAVFPARDIPGAAIALYAGGRIEAAWKQDLKCGEIVSREAVFHSGGETAYLRISQGDRALLRCNLEEPPARKDEAAPEPPERTREKEPVTADEMLAADQVEAAVKAFESAQIRGPRAATNYGIALMRLGRTDDALRQFETAADCDRPGCLAPYYAGAILLRRGETANARGMFEAAVRANPLDAKSMGALALASEKLEGFTQRTKSLYADVLRQCPCDLLANAQLAASGDGECAGRLAQFLGNGAQNRINLALQYLELGAVPNAQRYARQAVRLEPDNITARAILIVCAARGERGNIDDILKRIENVDIEKSVVYGGDDAVMVLEDALRASAENARLMLYLATAYETRRNWTAAWQMARKSSDRDPGVARAYLVQAQCLFRAPRSEDDDTARRRKAADLADQCLALNPPTTPYYYFSAWIYGSADRDRARVAAMRKAAEIDPDCFQAYHVLGWDAHDRGDYAEAARWFAKESNSPDHFGGESGLRYTYASWAQSLLDEKQYEQALEKAAESDKRKSYPDPELDLAKMRCLVGLGKQDEAVKLGESTLERLKNEQSDGPDPWNRYFAGCILEELKRTDEARAQWQKSRLEAREILDDHPGWDGPNYILAMSLNKLGQPKEALTCIEKLKRHFRQWPEARKAYEEISAAAAL